MTLAELEQRLPRPARSIDAKSTPGWDEAEQIIGHELPRDYKAFVDTYGSGSVDGFLSVLSPFASEPEGQLGRQTLALLGKLCPLGMPVYKQLPSGAWVVDDEGAHAGLPSWDKQWLPWAVLTDGGAMFWWTIGAPDTWEVVHVLPSPPGVRPAIESYRESMTDLLLALLAGRVKLPGAPPGFPGTSARYLPIAPKRVKATAMTLPPVNEDLVKIVKLKRPRRS